MKDSELQIGIIGKDGYISDELEKLLAQHPQARIAAQHSAHRQMIVAPEVMAQQCDVVFGCDKPEKGTSEQFAPAVLDAGKKFIDLGGAYRFKDPAVYGLTELFAEKIRNASLVANPGCYPTAFLLGMAPFLKHGMVDTNQTISVAAISGYSGAGKEYEQKRTSGIHPYSVVEHRHRAEMIQVIAAYTGAQVKIAFTPHVNDDQERGLETLAVFAPAMEPTLENIDAMFDEMYHDEPLVQYIKEIPEMNAVANTDLCQIAFWVQAGVIKVMAVLDNLRKGAATQAVQNMNLMFGLPKNTGFLSNQTTIT